MIDEEIQLKPCYRHANRTTALHCSNCERPICTECMIAAPVGSKCPECGTLPRTALAKVPLKNIARATGAGIVLAMFLGFIAIQFSQMFTFFSLVIAYLAGMAVADGVRRASGGYRDKSIAFVAGACAFVGMLWPYGLNALEGDAIRVERLLFPVLAAIIAAAVAYTRDA